MSPTAKPTYKTWNKIQYFQGDDDSNTYLSELLLGFLKYKKYAH